MIKKTIRLWSIALFLGWTVDFLFWKKPVGINLAIFTTLCLLGGVYLLLANQLRPALNSLWLLIPYVFFAIISFVRQEPLTLFMARIFTIFSIGMLAVTYLGGHWIQYRLTDYFNKFYQLIRSMLARPIGFFFQAHKEQVEHSEANKDFSIRPVMRGILIALPIVVLFAYLLATADVVFNQKLADIFERITLRRTPEYILRIGLILLYTYLLAGTFLHTESQSKDEKLVGEDQSIIKSFLGFTESSIILGSVAVLFFTFVMVQFRYFFGGVENIGVAGFTYSTYARRGFNELALVAFFSLLLILGLSAITRRETKIQRRNFSGLSVAIVIQVIVILVSAYQRITLGIQWHGYSRYRLYPRIFLIWVGLLLVAVIVLEILNRERHFALAAVLAYLGFAVSLTLFNVDAAIVRYNLDRAPQSGYLNHAHLASLSTDAIPALVAEFQSPILKNPIKEKIGVILLCYLHTDPILSNSAGAWRSLNLSHWKAREALDEVQSELEKYHVNDKRWPMRVRTPYDNLFECPG